MSDPQPSPTELALRWIQHGMRHRDQKQWTEALESFEKAISFEPRNPQAWALKGRALDEMNNLSEAIRCYKISLDINPSSASTWNNKGYAFRKQQKYSHALECYREAVRLQPSYAKAWYNMGYVLDKQGNYEAAIEAFDRAIELSPDNDKYVTSRKAVVATWTEFQKVFENPGSSLSTSSSTPAPPPPSASSVSSSSGPRSSREFSPAVLQVALNSSGLRESREFRDMVTVGPTTPTTATRDAANAASSTTSNNLHSSDGHSDTFNPFLDFEPSEATPHNTRRQPPTTTTTSSQHMAQQGLNISRPDSPPTTTASTSTTNGSIEYGLSSSHPESMAITMQTSRSSMDESLLHYAYIPSNPELSSERTERTGSARGHSSVGHSSQSSHHQQHTPSLREIPHHNHLRHGSTASSSTPNLHHLQHAHHSHSSGQSGSSSAILQKPIKKDKHASSERPHGSVSMMSRNSHDDSLAASSGSSGSSAGSLNGDHINQAVASMASVATTSPPMVHSRSMSSATTSSRPSHTSGLASTPASTQNLPLSLQQSIHLPPQQTTSAANQVEPNSSNDTESLLNTLQLSLQTAAMQRGESVGLGSINTTTTISTPHGTSNAAASALLGSPDGSDGELDLHVGPRAQTYLEAIYTHLQGVKSVRDAEKLEIALEEMLAAVRVKRNFLVSKASSSAADNEDKCSICWERPPEMVCIPCGHLCICEHCKSQLRTKKCPICGQAVKNIYKVFK